MDRPCNKRFEVIHIVSLVTQIKFPAMGNTADISVIGDTYLLDVARRHIDDLENKWSRFLASSDISRLNHSTGAPIRVSPETISLVQYLISAQGITRGAFDPTLLPVLIDLGYQTSFTQPEHVSTFASHPNWSLPMSSIHIEAHNNSISMPAGMTLDPGGLGKGLAADLVAQHLMDLGAGGVCISLGGDIRCMGQSPTGDAWTLPIETPQGTVDQNATFSTGAIATSSVHAKSWWHHSGEKHHVIDPQTKQPLSTTGIHAVQSTAIANEAVWAEVFSTAVLVQGAAIAFPLCDAHNIAAQIIFSNGTRSENSLWKEYVQ